MITRLLLGAGFLGALAGCGAAVPSAGVTHTGPVAQVVVTSSTHRLVSVAAGTATHATAAATATTTAPPAPRRPTAAAVPAAATPKAATSKPAQTAAPRPAAPVLRRNLLTGPHGLDTRVGPNYTDCTGATEVSHGIAVIDACHTGAVLFVGHNQGVFTPLLRFTVGDVITWSDGSGAVHHLRIVAVRNVTSSVFPAVLGTYEFQTCLYPVGHSPMDRELDAVEV